MELLINSIDKNMKIKNDFVIFKILQNHFSFSRLYIALDKKYINKTK